ncbi:iron-siderophore ABC transporter substrate-binding protein [Paenibacillus sp. SYP-B3998]|uniref:Iron-siderophore ABC transporter substrate-binding protein n=1 Tax=Paenibacillus sp. SYP-B3998 TaxID=2678564 RepID=A0A6G3ZW63_9BACL|nr:iron-siderophore ABC transporter substrate-binding protein [Paenibacillus sp. SYP-B3998]NEW06355.1 iron-siderophore ABC transporter substrate-binding protein [Paenibacillus sp. SYP-B3998]
MMSFILNKKKVEELYNMYPKIKFVWTISLLVSLVMFLGACSDSSNQGNNNAGVGTTNQAQAKNNESVNSNSVVKPVLAAPATIQHLKGEMTFENVPKKIVVLDVQYADQMLALGIKPAGSVVAETDNGLPPYLGDKMGNIPLLGTYLEPNLEGIIAIEPDLIIATDYHNKIYENLVKIAPTIILQRNEDWQTVLLKFGQILNKQQEAQEMVNGYKQKISDLKTALANKMKGQTVALIRPRDKMIRLQTTSHRTSQILYDDLGLTPPQMAINGKDTSVMISLEVIPELAADHMFLLQDDTNLELTTKFQDTSIWKNLKAVKDNHVYVENTAQWIGYYGPIAINLIVDQIADALK